MFKKKNRIAELFCLGVLATCSLLMFVCAHIGQRNILERMQVVHVHGKTTYKTILKSDSATDLIGFELHEDGNYFENNLSRPAFNVVVKSLDPAADDYKALCRDIVADIVSSYGNEEVVVNIYDSSEAYALAIDNEAGYKFLSAAEASYTNNHKVARYTFGTDEYEEQFHFTFYPDADNGLAEEVYYSSLYTAGMKLQG